MLVNEHIETVANKRMDDDAVSRSHRMHRYRSSVSAARSYTLDIGKDRGQLELH